MQALLKTYPRVMWLLSLAMVISAIGESFLWPITTTYIVHSFGKSLKVAALVLMLQHTGGLIGNVIGGLLFDRWNGRKTVMTAMIAAIVLLLLMGTIQRFDMYVVLLFLLGICTGMFWPCTRALAAVLWPEGGRAGMNMIYVAVNLGVAIGASVGGFVASQSYRLAFYGNACTYAVFLILFLRIVQDHHLKRTGKVQAEGNRRGTTEGREHPGVNIREWVSFGMLIAGLMLLAVTYTQWATTLSTYVYSLGIPLSSYSMLWTVNGLVIVLFQPVLTWFIRTFSLSLKAQIIIGGLFFTLSMLLISSSSAYWVFVLGMVIITWGEMLVWPGVPAIAADMAPAGREGFFQGIATTGQSVGRMVGPLLGSFLYETFSPQTMLLGMVVLTLVAAICFNGFDRIQKGKSVVTQTKSAG
ncbi:MDR family MFS transporter [Lihuaxuella thermophila]|uniref:Predicted arabinose efflux permease, MFS family n=1 Tax=Lihuaxuella thermophila TaxID=1173111 RepID=A0A1H8EAL7_9BACL|nr:MFS transporter [Lihuaxuella thermophila]SEN16601.1 Predicted arabinose efflux permease, MFS family [Lihuaxuella thermophila]